MAEQIPFSIIAAALSKLGSSAFDGIGSAFGVGKELMKLKEKLETVQAVLVDAEEKQVKSRAVELWVRRLKGVVYDADDLLDDFQTHQLQRGGVGRQVSHFFSSSNQLAFRFKMSERVKIINEAVDEIVKEIPLLNLIQLGGNSIADTRGAELLSNWRETHSFVLTSQVVGREENKQEIINSLLSSSDREQEVLSMVAIVGIGGLGKTTLAQLVFNDEKVTQYFDPRIWVCVSDPFDVNLLVKKILKEVVSDRDLEKLELNGLKNLLHEEISQKRCLLVLDDVWNEDSEKWDQLRTLLMVVGKGSKILLTTRHAKVASIMGIHSPFLLQGLKDNQPWDLFAKIVFLGEPETVHPKFVEIGKEIVDMCNGVPLIIKAMGTMLRSKTEVSQWLSIKNNENLLSLGDGNDNVLSVLKLSYDNLPPPLKQCFGYCSIFPKDYEIQKRSLLQMWMAHGYIQPVDERKGELYFDQLLSRSLLEVCKRDVDDNIVSCKMHDLIHDLALSVIGSEVLILEDDVNKVSKEVRHLSLFNSRSLKLASKLKAKNIRTFNLCIAGGYDQFIKPTECFSNLECLRVLSLDGSYIEQESRCLDKLNHLRYLDLSYSWVEVLPDSIANLKNLQTIKLVDCRVLRELPKDTRKMINLRHLENYGCESLSHMPGGIGELTMLQSLPVFVVGNGRGDGRLSELKGLNNLRGELWIKKLENVRSMVVESEEAILGVKQHIQSLLLSWRDYLRDDKLYHEEDELVLEGLRPHPNLEQLRITGYGGGKFPSWMMKGRLSRMLPNLTTVYIYGCSRCQTLPCFVLLPHLRYLKLYKLGMVEYIEEYCSSEGPFFPSLQELYMSGMPKLKKELWKMESVPEPPPIFLCLRELSIIQCDDLGSLDLPPSPLLSKLQIMQCNQLASMKLQSSPVLSEVDISDCHNLTTLQLPPSHLLSKLIIDDCSALTSLELHSSPVLSDLYISCCNNLTTLQLPASPLLSKLEIRRCVELASLELHSYPVLSELSIYYCRKVTTLLLLPSPLLSVLKIEMCDELAYVELRSSPCLSVICISYCPNLTTIQLPPSPLLSLLNICYCNRLASMELHSSPILSEVRISHCPKLKTLHLPPSPFLQINKCDQLTSLSLELHPSPILSELHIFNCLKLKTLRVSSLSCLKILNLSDVGEEILQQSILSTTASSLEDVSIFWIDNLMHLPDELHLHASTLHTLRIHGCSRLATLPDWIGNLTSLIDLGISRCPKLTSLPEEMRSLTALDRLDISDCPRLSERCQREIGEDWPKIAHVPRITIDGSKSLQMV